MYDHIRKGLWKLHDPVTLRTPQEWEPTPDADILQSAIASTALGPIATEIIARWLEANDEI